MSCRRFVRFGRGHLVQAQHTDTAAAFVGEPCPRVVDEHAAHQLRSQADEMRAALPIDGLLPDQAHEGFVHERRLLHRVIRALAPQVALRQLPQLFVHERRQLGERALVAVPPLGEQLSHGLLHAEILAWSYGRYAPHAMTALHTWHEVARTRNVAGLDALLADDVVFHSPVVHTPQVGKTITALYLAAAFQVFFNESFRYVREIAGRATRRSSSRSRSTASPSTAST